MFGESIIRRVKRIFGAAKDGNKEESLLLSRSQVNYQTSAGSEANNAFSNSIGLVNNALNTAQAASNQGVSRTQFAISVNPYHLPWDALEKKAHKKILENYPASQKDGMKQLISFMGTATAFNFFWPVESLEFVGDVGLPNITDEVKQSIVFYTMVTGLVASVTVAFLGEVMADRSRRIHLAQKDGVLPNDSHTEWAHVLGLYVPKFALGFAGYIIVLLVLAGKRLDELEAVPQILASLGIVLSAGALSHFFARFFYYIEGAVADASVANSGTFAQSIKDLFVGEGNWRDVKWVNGVKETSIKPCKEIAVTQYLKYAKMFAELGEIGFIGLSFVTQVAIVVGLFSTSAGQAMMASLSTPGAMYACIFAGIPLILGDLYTEMLAVVKAFHELKQLHPITNVVLFLPALFLGFLAIFGVHEFIELVAGEPDQEAQSEAVERMREQLQAMMENVNYTAIVTQLAVGGVCLLPPSLLAYMSMFAPAAEIVEQMVKDKTHEWRQTNNESDKNNLRKAKRTSNCLTKGAKMLVAPVLGCCLSPKKVSDWDDENVLDAALDDLHKGEFDLHDSLNYKSNPDSYGYA